MAEKVGGKEKDCIRVESKIIFKDVPGNANYKKPGSML